jgi:splicing factor 3B subunit 4
MNGQYLGGRPIGLSYAYKKEGPKGGRHGSTAERRLAEMGKKNNVLVTGFLPPSGLAALAGMPPIPLPQGFSQAAGAGQPGAPPAAPPAPPAGFAPPPAGPPGFANAQAPGQAAPPGFGPPPGMPPPPALNQFGR